VQLFEEHQGSGAGASTSKVKQLRSKKEKINSQIASLKGKKGSKKQIKKLKKEYADVEAQLKAETSLIAKGKRTGVG